MKTFRILGLALFAILLCLSACSGGNDDPIEPAPKPEVPKSEITIDSSIISNGLSFSDAGGEQSINFSANENWTLSVASTTSGTAWCTASVTSGTKGSASVKFAVVENTTYDNRSVSVTIKSGTASKTFTISQKGVDALLVTTDKYEVAQEGGTISIEVKANINYQMEISKTAKDWIKESSSRALTTYNHTLSIAANEETEKREGEIYFKSGDKVETVRIYQAGGAILLLTDNEYQVSDKGDTISVDIKSNIEFGVQMPDVDWIVDEASSRGLSSHTLKYIISANEGYDSRSAEIVFYDKNSDLKDTLVVNQAQKDAIVLSQKEITVARVGRTIKVKVASNVDFEVQIPSEATWITQADSRALTEKSVYLKVSENTSEENRSAEILFKDKNSTLSNKVIVSQKSSNPEGYINGILTLKNAGTMKNLLGKDYLKITSLKVVGPINGSDISYLRQMLSGTEYFYSVGQLTTLDLSEAKIVEGGKNYYSSFKTSNDVIGKVMFARTKLKKLIMPAGVTSIDEEAFFACHSLTSIEIPDGVTSIGNSAFSSCTSLTSVYIEDLSAWCNITFGTSTSNPLNSNGGKLYLNNNRLTELVIPADIRQIKDYAFWRCESITKLTIGEGVISIGKSAFYNCSSLTSINMSESVTSIGIAAFYGCSSLASINISDNVTSIGNSTFKYCSSLTSIDIPNSVSSIGESAFLGCSSLTSIHIPYSVTAIGLYAFYDCTSLTSVHIEDLSAWCNITFRDYSSNPLNSNGGKLYLNNKELTELVIPADIKQIKDYTFYSCKSITKVTMGEQVTSIGADAFKYCSSLASVYIEDLSAWCNITFSNSSSNPLNDNGGKLYLNNKELTVLVIPTDIKQIKDYTFYGCKSITKVTMSEQVTSVGIHSFIDCSSLTLVYCQGTTPPTINSSSINSSFNGSSSSKTLYVPKGYSSAYQASDWASFFGTIKEME